MFVETNIGNNYNHGSCRDGDINMKCCEIDHLVDEFAKVTNNKLSSLFTLESIFVGKFKFFKKPI